MIAKPDLKVLKKLKKGSIVILHENGTFKYIKTKVISFKFNKDNGNIKVSLLYFKHNKLLHLTSDSNLFEPTKNNCYIDSNKKEYFIYNYTTDNLYKINKYLYNIINND